jgi:hypothetical protein
MEGQKMKVKRRLIKISNSIYLPISNDMKQHLGIDDLNMEIEWQDDEGKHGKFISFWVSK